MPRRPSVHWDEAVKAYRSDSGERGKGNRRKPVYFRDLPPTEKGKREAERLLKEYLAERDRREALEVESGLNPTLWKGVFVPFLLGFQDLVDRGEREQSTHQAHYLRLKAFARSVPLRGKWVGVKLGHRRLNTLEADDGARWVEETKQRGCGPVFVNGVLASVKTALTWAATPDKDRQPRQILPINPFQHVKRLPAREKPRRLPSRKEGADLLRAAWRDAGKWKKIGRRCAGCIKAKRKDVVCRRSHTKESAYSRVAVLALRMQLNCGTRPSELCRATWGPTEKCPEAGWTARAWQDPATGHWWGRIVVWGKTTRATGKARRIPVPPALVRSIERVREAGLNPVYIFPRLSRGTSTNGSWNVNDLGRLVRRWRELAGLEDHLVLYRLRHRIYTRAVHEGDLSADQAGAVGGTSGETVRRTYLHADDAAVFEHATQIRKGHQSR